MENKKFGIQWQNVATYHLDAQQVYTAEDGRRGTLVELGACTIRVGTLQPGTVLTNAYGVDVNSKYDMTSSSTNYGPTIKAQKAGAASPTIEFGQIQNQFTTVTHFPAGGTVYIVQDDTHKMIADGDVLTYADFIVDNRSNETPHI
jgi:hypothetical protein